MESYNSISLTRFAATICRSMGIEPPECAEPALDWVCNALDDICKEGFDRVLIHNPDAVGMWLAKKHPDAFDPVLKHTHLTIPFRSPMPSVTPVCFATMYTGAAPEIHGIQAYVKPIVPIDTFFEAVVRAGKKVAILAMESVSMSRIFIGKGADIYNCSCEGAIVAKAKELMLKDEYDVLCVYTYSFDSMNHKYGPDAKETVEALYDQGIYFDSLVSAVKRNWKQHNTLVTFSTDHGVHTAEEGDVNSKGLPVKGTHGSKRPADLNILHYIGVVHREREPDYTE